MEMDTPYEGAVQPEIWYVVFHPKTGVGPWVNFFARGKFKHVSAFAYVPGFKTWVFFDSQWRGMFLVHMSQIKAEEAFLAYINAGCSVLKIKKDDRPLKIWHRFGMYCVPAVRHLIGAKGVALTPTGFYHDVLRNGGESVSVGHATPAD